MIPIPPMKNAVKSVLQQSLGFRNYLFAFSWYKVVFLRHDARESDFFQFLRLLPPEGTVLDIGANIGIMSVHLSRKLARGRVLAFEPMPENLDALRRILRHFDLRNVEVHACALGDHEGEVEMVMPLEGRAKLQGLSHIVHESITERNEGIRVKVPLRTLDTMEELFRPDTHLTGIKMDVENSEAFVLAGGLKLLERWSPVLYIELWDNDNRRRCFELLHQLGYQAKVVDGCELVDYRPERHPNQNFIFVRRFANPGEAH
jgi:FkbM family methyltransferase